MPTPSDVLRRMVADAEATSERLAEEEWREYLEEASPAERALLTALKSQHASFALGFRLGYGQALHRLLDLLAEPSTKP